MHDTLLEGKIKNSSNHLHIHAPRVSYVNAVLVYYVTI